MHTTIKQRPYLLDFLEKIKLLTIEKIQLSETIQNNIFSNISLQILVLALEFWSFSYI